MFFNSLNQFNNFIQPPSYVDKVHNFAVESLVFCCVCGAIRCMWFMNNLLFVYEAAVPIFILIILFKSDVIFPMAKLCIQSGLDNATNSNSGVVIVCSVGRLTISFSNALSFSQ